jgi:hypothetical protein
MSICRRKVSLRAAKKLVLYVFAFLLFIPLFFGRAEAARNELVTLECVKNIYIIVTYDKEKPDITIISPSGVKYSKDSDYSAVERGNLSIYLYIENADAGKWYVDCDKKSNNNVNIAIYPWYKDITIKNIVINGVSNAQLSATAEVTSDAEQYFDYYCYAVLENSKGEVTSRKEIQSGSGYTNSTLDISAPTDGLIDGEYYLEIEICVIMENGSELSTFELSSSVFSVAGNSTIGDSTEWYTILDLTEDTLYLDWSDSSSEVSSWIVGLYKQTDGNISSEPFYYESYENDVCNDSIWLDRDDGDLYVTITGLLVNGGYIEYKKSIIWDTDVKVEFSTEEKTNSTQCSISYNAANNVLRGKLTINDKSEQIQLKDSGILSFSVDETEVNEVSIQYSWEKGTYYRLSKRISVDNIPPFLDLYGISGEITVSEPEISVSGKTEVGALLFVNEKQYEVAEDGSYLFTLALSKGKNTFVFEAQDDAGNKSTRTAIIIYSQDGEVGGAGLTNDEKPLVLGITTLITLPALLIMGLTGLIEERRCHKRGLSKGIVWRKVLAVFRGVLWCIFVESAIATGLLSFLYFRTSNQISGENLPTAIQSLSAIELAKLLEKVSEYRTATLVSIIGTVFSLAGLIIVYAIRVTNRKKYEKTHCPNCGNKIKPNAHFCEICGYQIK